MPLYVSSFFYWPLKVIYPPLYCLGGNVKVNIFSEGIEITQQLGVFLQMTNLGSFPGIPYSLPETVRSDP